MSRRERVGLCLALYAIVILSTVSAAASTPHPLRAYLVGLIGGAGVGLLLLGKA